MDTDILITFRTQLKLQTHQIAMELIPLKFIVTGVFLTNLSNMFVFLLKNRGDFFNALLL